MAKTRPEWVKKELDRFTPTRPDPVSAELRKRLNDPIGKT